MHILVKCVILRDKMRECVIVKCVINDSPEKTSIGILFMGTYYIYACEIRSLPGSLKPIWPNAKKRQNSISIVIKSSYCIFVDQLFVIGICDRFLEQNTIKTDRKYQSQATLFQSEIFPLKL